MYGAVLGSVLRRRRASTLTCYAVSSAGAAPPTSQGLEPSLRRCYELLDMTSRSFAAVIQQLDVALRPAICIFYLVLRGLDTIEDDMALPRERKVPLLRSFHEVLRQRGWTFTESGPNEKDRQLLVEFDIVILEFSKLKPAFQDSIADITRRMGAGMAEFVDRKGVDTAAEWDVYCHYVAGLVGIGLSRIFAQSGLEDAAVGEREDLANSMGLFLQKTNIIRDYLEDLEDGRIFWPKQIWQRHARELADFRRPAQRVAALACLNHLITDALRHVPDVFAYMGALRNQTVFNFCAIPQVMAIATLARCYNNYAVFCGVVKIRKGEAVKMILEARSMDALARVFHEHLADISRHFATMETPYYATAELILRIRKTCGLPDDPNITSTGALVRPRPTAGKLLLRRTLRWSLLTATVGGAVYVLLRTPIRDLPPALQPVQSNLLSWQERALEAYHQVREPQAPRA